jgi:hypothetical protein
VLAAALLALAMAPVVLPDRGAPFAVLLAGSGTSPDGAAFVGDVHTATETRLHAGVADPFIEVDRLDDAVDSGLCVIMTTERRDANRLMEQGFAVSTVKGGWREIDIRSLFGAIFSWRLAEARELNGSAGYFAHCSRVAMASE